MFLLLLLGFLSGAASFYSLTAFTSSTTSSDALFYLPGSFFGAMIAIYFVLFRKAKFPIIGPLLFIVIATGSYYAAVYTTFTLWPGLWSSILGDSDLVISFSLMSAGFLGSFLTLIGFSMLLSPLILKNLLIASCIGAVLGLTWYIIPEGTFYPVEKSSIFGGDPYQENLLSLFLFWQAGMAGVLGFLMKKKELHIFPRLPLHLQTLVTFLNKPI